MNQAERYARLLLVDALSQEGRDDEATPHCVVLGEYKDASEPLTALFVVPLDIEREQLREARGKAINVDFTVDAQGFVINPRIMSSTVDGLDEVALAAISQFRYAPRFVDGEPVVTTNVHYTFDISREGRMGRVRNR
jgi:TonB family protein